jgi:predicted RNase H-like HicB family nuclease
MNYRVVITETNEYVAVSCPALKGCHSQGKTKTEALENIRDAIREWLSNAEMEKSIISVTEEDVSM